MPLISLGWFSLLPLSLSTSMTMISLVMQQDMAMESFVTLSNFHQQPKALNFIFITITTFRRRENEKEENKNSLKI